MCGIAGIFDFHKSKVKKSALETSLEALGHRGPDGQGLFFSSDGHAGMSHTRLAIIDLSETGAQPMKSADSKCAITFNGEIYNFESLKSNELLKDVKFRSNSDTEVLLQLYQHSSSVSEFVAKRLPLLNGIFAFGIWDESKKIGLICRDQFGVKPLYYLVGDRSLVFASEIKALRALVGSSFCRKESIAITGQRSIHRVNNEAIDGHMNYLWNPNSLTLFPNIKKLGPGEWLMFKADGSVNIADWTHNLNYNGVYGSTLRAKTMSTKSLVSNVTELTRNAIHDQMISDVPVGAFLSGGVDSSAIVAFAREKNPDLQCFTLRSQGYDQESLENDYFYAKNVASHLDVPLITVDVTPSDFVEQLNKMIEILEEPTADPAALNVFYISEIARQNGIKVLLSGTGGDDVFSGYRRHLAIYHSEKWSVLSPSFRKLIESWSRRLPSFRGSNRKIRKLLNGFSMSKEDYLLNSFKWSSDIDLFSLYSVELRNRLKNYKSDQTMSAFLSTYGNGMSQLKKALALEKRFFLAEHNLIYTDKMSMAAGVEVRVPFLNQELVSFANKIPDNFLVRGICPKWILKKAMEPYLPKKIIYRPKTGFGLPIRQWIKNELNDFVNDTLNERVLRNRGLFDPSGVKSLIKANAEGSVDGSYTILSIICIELWCQKFLEC